MSKFYCYLSIWCYFVAKCKGHVIIFLDLFIFISFLLFKKYLQCTMVVLQMEFVLNVQELCISCQCVFPCKKNNKSWKKPDPDEEDSNKWKFYLYIVTFFNSDEKEDDSIGNSQEEVSLIIVPNICYNSCTKIGIITCNYFVGNRILKEYYQ